MKSNAQKKLEQAKRDAIEAKRGDLISELSSTYDDMVELRELNYTELVLLKHTNRLLSPPEIEPVAGKRKLLEAEVPVRFWGSISSASHSEERTRILESAVRNIAFLHETFEHYDPKEMLAMLLDAELDGLYNGLADACESASTMLAQLEVSND